MTSTHADRDQVVIERQFDAPVALVWAMWTEPEHFKAWYGPPGSSIPVARMDVRVGGSRLVCMEVQTPAGPRQMWFTGEYLEVVPQTRLAYTESLADEQGNALPPTDPGHPQSTQVRVHMQSVDGGTRMVLTHVGIPAGSPGAAGWQAALDQLAVRLAA